MATYNTSFVINLADLTKILEQIKIAERHAAGENLIDIIGADSALLPMGLRTVDGSYNHLLPGQELAGAADQLFTRLLPPAYRIETDGDSITLVPAGTPGAPPGGVVITNGNYDPSLPTPPGAPPTHSVADADPRIISNLIVDQTITNPSALAAALKLAGAVDPFGDAMAIIAARQAVIDARAAAEASSTAAVAALLAALQAEQAALHPAADRRRRRACRSVARPGRVRRRATGPRHRLRQLTPRPTAAVQRRSLLH